jgi:hypothetical protein
MLSAGFESGKLYGQEIGRVGGRVDYPAIVSDRCKLDCILVCRFLLWFLLWSSHPSQLFCNGIMTLHLTHNSADRNLDENILTTFPALTFALTTPASTGFDNTPAGKFM